MHVILLGLGVISVVVRFVIIKMINYFFVK